MADKEYLDKAVIMAIARPKAFRPIHLLTFNCHILPHSCPIFELKFDIDHSADEHLLDPVDRGLSLAEFDKMERLVVVARLKGCFPKPLACKSASPILSKWCGG